MSEYPWNEISHLHDSTLFTIPLKISQNSQENSCARAWAPAPGPHSRT